jgi:hypothetical protein
LPHLPALFRHPFAGGWVRHPNGTGTAGPSGRRDDHDLHSRVTTWGDGSPESDGSAVAGGVKPRRPFLSPADRRSSATEGWIFDAESSQCFVAKPSFFAAYPRSPRRERRACSGAGLEDSVGVGQARPFAYIV